jgi:hypothetical protein
LDVLDEDDNNLFDPDTDGPAFLDAANGPRRRHLPRWSDKQVGAPRRWPNARRMNGRFSSSGRIDFGHSARVARALDRAFHNELVEGNDDARLLYVLGWDFHPFGVRRKTPTWPLAQAGRDERIGHPFVGSTDDNLAQVRDQGDLAVPFYYDLLVGAGVPGWDGFWPRRGKRPTTITCWWTFPAGRAALSVGKRSTRR